jgi:hypothetical protein
VRQPSERCLPIFERNIAQLHRQQCARRASTFVQTARLAKVTITVKRNIVRSTSIMCSYLVGVRPAQGRPRSSN